MSDTPADLTPLVDAVAASPAMTNVDGAQVQQQNLKDLDDVSRRRTNDRAVKKPRRGLFFNKLNPPGAS